LAIIDDSKGATMDPSSLSTLVDTSLNRASNIVFNLEVISSPIAEDKMSVFDGLHSERSSLNDGVSVVPAMTVRELSTENCSIKQSPSLQSGLNRTIMGSGTHSLVGRAQQLRDILDDKVTRDEFLAFLKSIYCEENLLFWIDVEDLKQRWMTLGAEPAELRLKIEHVFGSYLSVDAPIEININHRIRDNACDSIVALLQRFSSASEKTFNVNELSDFEPIFGPVQDSVFHMMATDSVPKFLRSGTSAVKVLTAHSSRSIPASNDPSMEGLSRFGSEILQPASNDGQLSKSLDGSAPQPSNPRHTSLFHSGLITRSLTITSGLKNQASGEFHTTIDVKPTLDSSGSHGAGLPSMDTAPTKVLRSSLVRASSTVKYSANKSEPASQNSNASGDKLELFKFKSSRSANNLMKVDSSSGSSSKANTNTNGKGTDSFLRSIRVKSSSAADLTVPADPHGIRGSHNRHSGK
jgi:hypothetical protein